MSLSYTKLPVYIGQASGVTITESLSYVPAIQTSVNYRTAHSPKRSLGINIATGEELVFGGALTANISINCILQAGLESGFLFLETASQEAYVPIQIGDNLFQKCYVTDVSVDVEPYIPAKFNAQFVCLDPPTGISISGDQNPYGGGEIPFSGDTIVYGHTCSVSNMGRVVGSVQSNVNFKRSYGRTPVYNIGSINASSMLLDSVEEELTITSTGLNTFINLSGDLLHETVGVTLKSPKNIMSEPLVELITMTQGATVVNQDYGVNEGDTVGTTITIKQIKL